VIARLAVVVVAGLALAAPAAAAPPWGEPATLTQPAQLVADPAIAFSPFGEAFVGWSSARHARVGLRKGDGDLRAIRTAGGGLLDDPAAVGDGMALLEARVVGRLVELRVPTFDADGTPHRPYVAARVRHPQAASFAAEHGGSLAVAWVDLRYRLHLVTGDVRRGFGRPRVIGALGGPGHPDYVDIDIGFSDIELVIASVRRGRRAEVRTGRPGALRRQTLGPAGGVTDVRVGAAFDGRAVVLWGAQDGGEEANKPYVVRAAIRAARNRRFGRPQVLADRGAPNRPAGELSLEVGLDGTAVAAWSSAAGPRYPYAFPVMAATAPPGGRFGAAAQLDASGAVGDIALSLDGDALVVWSRILSENYQEPDQVFAALRPAGGAFGPPEEVSPNEVATEPAAAFDGDGRPAVVWAARPGGPRVDQGGGRNAVLRMARRG
jgi:hypothetical protein